MYHFKLVYRFKNNEVEGFKGIGFTSESSKKDALNQIKKKLASFQILEIFDAKRVYENNRALNQKELDTVVLDWQLNVRYK